MNHSVDTIYMFKACLDKFWMHQDVKYDFTADLTGIGDRSVHEMSGLLFLKKYISEYRCGHPGIVHLRP